MISLTGGLADFEKTFIQCIVYNFEMLKEYKDEASLKGAGKIMTKGKDYVVADGTYNLETSFRSPCHDWVFISSQFCLYDYFVL